MSKIKVTQIQPLSGTVLYLTGTLSASAGLEFPNQTISGSTAILTTLTASKAYIDVLDVNQINSTTTTETTLEVVDKLIIAASGSSGSAVNDGGYQIGGYSDTTYPAASMIFSASALKFNVTGATSPVMYLSGSGKVGIGVTDPDTQLEVFSTGTQLKLSYDGSNYATLAVSSGGDLTVDASGGDIALSDNVTVAGNVTLGDAASDVITATGQFTGSNGMTVTGSAKFKDAAEFAAAVSFASALTGTAGMAMTGSAKFNSEVEIAGVTSFAAAVTGSNGMAMTGSVKLANTLEVAGAAEFDGNVTLGNAASDVTTVTGQFTGSNGAYITGSVLISGSVTMGTEATDVITIVGQLTASNGIEVDTIILSNELTASSIEITNNLTANGTSSLDGPVVINESGADKDFRVESDGNANMLFVDASHNRVGIGTSSPWTALDVDGHLSLSTQSDPGTQSGKISLYAKNISGVAELIVQDDAGNRTTISQLNHQTLLEDNNAEAYKFLEGTTHYMVFSTENGEEKITSSKNFIFSGSISGSAGMEMTGSAKFTSGNDAAGTIVVRSGNASQYSKISMGTNANKATIGVPGGSDTFFSDTAAGDLVLRVDDNNGKIHIGAGTSGGAGLIVTEHGGSDPRIGIGTASPNAALDVAGHVFPHSDDTYDLGSTSYRWRNIYTGDLHLRNDRGDWTIVEEEDFLCVINNKTGKKYEMMLKPLDED